MLCFWVLFKPRQKETHQLGGKKKPENLPQTTKTKLKHTDSPAQGWSGQREREERLGHHGPKSSGSWGPKNSVSLQALPSPKASSWELSGRLLVVRGPQQAAFAFRKPLQAMVLGYSHWAFPDLLRCPCSTGRRPVFSTKAPCSLYPYPLPSAPREFSPCTSYSCPYFTQTDSWPSPLSLLSVLEGNAAWGQALLWHKLSVWPWTNCFVSLGLGFSSVK